MRLLFKLTLLAVGIFPLLNSCQKKADISLIDNLHDGFRLAKEQNRKVLLIVGTTDCGKCTKFIEYISNDSKMRKSLEDDFIVVYDKSEENVAAKITHCLAYPMPFVFDKEGRLLSFGDIMEKGGSFNDIQIVSLGEFDFLELFRINISQKQFKQMVSQSMKAYLCISDTCNYSNNISLAYEYAKKSVDVSPYCYNLNLAYQLGKKLDRPNIELKSYLIAMRNGIEAMDRHLYPYILKEHFGLSSKEIKEIGDNKQSDITLSTTEITIGKINKKTKHSFSFQLTNLGMKPIIIRNIRASCSCVDVKFPKRPILPKTSCQIEGVFEPTHKGKFLRVLSVHTNSKQSPLKTIAIKGTVI